MANKSKQNMLPKEIISKITNTTSFCETGVYLLDLIMVNDPNKLFYSEVG